MAQPTDQNPPTSLSAPADARAEGGASSEAHAPAAESVPSGATPAELLITERPITQPRGTLSRATRDSQLDEAVQSPLFDADSVTWIPSSQPLPPSGAYIPPHELPAYIFRDALFTPKAAALIARRMERADGAAPPLPASLPAAHLARHLDPLFELDRAAERDPPLAESLASVIAASPLAESFGALIESIEDTDRSPHIVLHHIRLTAGTEIFPHRYLFSDHSGSERRYIQLLVCLSEGWSPSWGGGVEVVSAGAESGSGDRTSYVPPLFNRATAVLMVPGTFTGFTPVALPAADAHRVLHYLRVLFLPRDTAELTLAAAPHEESTEERLLELALCHRLPRLSEGARPELLARIDAVFDSWLRYVERDRSVLVRQLRAAEQIYLEMANRAGPTVRGFGYATRLFDGWYPDQWLEERCGCSFIAEDPVSAVALVVDCPESMPESSEVELELSAAAEDGSPIERSWRGPMARGPSVIRLETGAPIVGPLELRVHFFGSWRPRESYGSDDPRTLTVRLRSIRLEPAPGTSLSEALQEQPAQQDDGTDATE